MKAAYEQATRFIDSYATALMEVRALIIEAKYAEGERQRKLLEEAIAVKPEHWREDTSERL